MLYRLDKTDENDEVNEREVENDKSSISEWSPAVDGSSEDIFVMLFS